MFNHKPIACASLLILTGCVPLQTQPETPTQQVPASPFAEPKKPAATRVSYAPASQEASYRVVQIKDQLTGKNPQYGLKPFALAIGSPETEIFHVGNTIYITEGLVRQCGTDGELAAALSFEMGRMVAEREATVSDDIRQPERQLPISFPVGGGGNDSDVNPLGRIELIRHEKAYPRQPRKLARPNPELVARSILENAGYPRTELDAVLPKLQSGDRISVLESQFKGTVKQSDWIVP